MSPLKHDLATQMLSVSELVPWSRNPRRNDAAAERLAYTIQTHGWTTPILVQAGTRRIIGGHTRLKAALKLGLTEVPCVLLDVDDRQADAIAIADNRLGELAEWDADELGALLRELDDAGADMAAVGYDDAEIAELLAALGDGDAGPLPDDGEVTEPPAVPDSVPGEVYELGPHRLVCGDCTSTVAQVAMDGADAVVTDPPYGIDASRFGMGATTDKDRARVGATAGSTRWDTDAPPVAWMLDGFSLVCVWGGNYFSDLPVSDDWLIWDKKMRGLSFGEAELAWTNFGKRTRVLQHHWSGEVKQHITQKPLPVIEWCLGFLPDGCSVADPFAGSGTTLIACARTGRTARLVELDPGYCDVIRRRYGDWARKAGLDPGPGAL